MPRGDEKNVMLLTDAPFKALQEASGNTISTYAALSSLDYGNTGWCTHMVIRAQMHSLIYTSFQHVLHKLLSFAHNFIPNVPVKRHTN